MSARPPRARTVILDADSTLAAIEGIDWLAERRPPAVAGEIAALTAQAMAGMIALEAVYGARLAAVAPSHTEVMALADAYAASLAPGADTCIAALRAAEVRVLIVSGGIRPALLPVAASLGIAADDVHAVELFFDDSGAYRDFDRTSPLARQHGKADLVASLALRRPILAVGDGSTDLAIRTARACDAFAAFTAFARRAPVVTGADLECASFHALQLHVLGTP
jgi:phosphoserine phosphatase